VVAGGGRTLLGDRKENDEFLHHNSHTDLIRLKRTYNFLCSMLVYTPVALCSLTLRGVFMHFPELTY
jgi:hypothetical protein